MVAHVGRDRPNVSVMHAIVLAVKSPEQLPAHRAEKPAVDQTDVVADPIAVELKQGVMGKAAVHKTIVVRCQPPKEN